MKRYLISFVVAVLFVSLPVFGGINDGLVAHWTFDEPSGNTVYDSAGTNDGTIHGVQLVAGISGGALYFDGLNDYVEAPDNASLRPGYITMSAWVISQNTYNAVMEKSRYSDDSYLQYTLGVSSYGNAGGTITRNSSGLPGSGFYSCNGETVLSNNAWSLITSTWDGTSLKVYVNGKLDGVNSSIPSGPIDDYAGGTLRFGNHWSGDPAWSKGIMDDVRIYNRALSADEVAQLYAIPEPATLLLLSLGGLFLRKRK